MQAVRVLRREKKTRVCSGYDDIVSSSGFVALYRLVGLITATEVLGGGRAEKAVPPICGCWIVDLLPGEK
jgi:hypothetical protein